jgi:hypothetical protein
MNFNLIRIQVSIVVATIAILAGCNSQKPKLSVNDHFRPDDEPRAMNNIFAAQVAVAAREDGQLFVHHFTGGQLNSLGMQKLMAITGGQEVGKIAIYLSLPKDGDYAARQLEVIRFLEARGTADDRFVVIDGANPKLGSPAAGGLAGLSKHQGPGAGADAGGVSTK